MAQLIFTLIPGYVLLAGDFNTRHKFWGCRTSCQHGLNIFNAYNKSNYVLLNNGYLTTIVTPRGRANALDLLLPPSSLLISKIGILVQTL